MTERIYEWEDITPEIVKIWGYDEDMILMEQDEDLLLYDFELVPALLELSSDNECPKREYAHFILCQFCREQVTRGSEREVAMLKECISKLPKQPSGLPELWLQYVNRLIDYTENPKPVSKELANEIAHDLLIGIAGRVGSVAEEKSPVPGCWRFTLKTSVIEHIDICIDTGKYKYVPYY